MAHRGHSNFGMGIIGKIGGKLENGFSFSFFSKRMVQEQTGSGCYFFINWAYLSKPHMISGRLWFEPRELEITFSK